MIERVVRRTLRGQRLHVARHLAVGQRRAIDDRDHAIHGHAILDRRPVERLDQRLWQREPGGLDHDVIGLHRAREQLLHEREVGSEWIGVADYDSAQVRSFGLEHVEDSRLFAQNCACMQRDRSTGDPAGSG